MQSLMILTLFLFATGSFAALMPRVSGTGPQCWACTLTDTQLFGYVSTTDASGDLTCAYDAYDTNNNEFTYDCGYDTNGNGLAGNRPAPGCPATATATAWTCPDPAVYGAGTVVQYSDVRDGTLTCEYGVGTTYSGPACEYDTNGDGTPLPGSYADCVNASACTAGTTRRRRSKAADNFTAVKRKAAAAAALGRPLTPRAL